MVFSGVEVLKMQFSRAIDQTFESFLDSWTPALREENLFTHGNSDGERLGTEIPVTSSM